MYLKEIVINGFKSFADRTRILLQPGVTTIVGPNGCGKSNIVDAIRWVLGEQSAKALRGGKMQDVIFEGTDKRKPHNWAEVTLTFTDCEDKLGTSFNEVSITRKVSREGASGYYLNGKSCRLKDIHNLFMDTGIGRASYSFMMQGQIDQILSNNPVERRTIFEEAAGITKYKSQRKEALNKLTLVEQNLTRAIDVMEEVARQLGSQKRQATKALRYKRLKYRLTHLELASFSYQYAQRQGAVGELQEKEAAARESVGELQASLKDREEVVVQKKSLRTEKYNSLEQIQQQVFDLKSEKELAESQAELARVRYQDIQKRLEGIAQEKTELTEKKENFIKQAEGDAQQKQSQLEEVGASDSIFKEKNDALTAAQSKLDETEKELHQKKHALLAIENSANRLRARATSFEVDLKTQQVKETTLQESLEKFEAIKSELLEQENAIQQALQQAEKDKESAQTGVQEFQGQLTSKRDVFREVQKKIQDQDRHVTRLQTQQNALEGLQAKFEGFSQGAKAVLQGKLGDALPKEAYQLLSQFVSVEEAYMQSFETLLGPSMDAIVLKDASLVSNLCEAMEEKQLGRACWQIEVKECSSTNPGQLPQGVCVAMDVVSAREESLKPFLTNLLNGCYFVDTLDTFLAFWKDNPDFNFLLAATAQGELIDRRGLVFGGNSGKKNNQSSFIQRAAEIRRLKKEIEKETQLLDQLNEQAEQLQKEFEALESALEEKRSALLESQQAYSKAQGEERSFQSSMRQNQEGLERAQRDFDKLASSRTQVQENLEKAQGELQEEEARMHATREGITSLEENVTQFREERDARREALSEVRFELTEKRQQLELIESGLNQIRRQTEDLERRIQSLQNETESLSEQAASLVEDEKAQQEKITDVETQLESATQSLEETRNTVLALEEEIKAIDKSLAGERSELHAYEKSLNQIEVKLAEERSHCQFLLEKATAEHEVELSEVDWKHHLWQAGDSLELKVTLEDIEEELTNAASRDIAFKMDRGEPTEEDLEKLEATDWNVINIEVKELRNRINNLGAVNPDAIEEYVELKERHDFLSNQTQDLINAKDELLKAIEKINEESQKLFADTFDKVRTNFRFTFEKLFGGGQADLQLMDSEDVLESGIDITARPPGTRLKGLTLLSGGQRTMTAVALLFAIYMVKPSPFCVLDELDAPLDDANIGRFTNILREFTEYSQFLVISHNKRTIAASDSIYGVTMQEKGVTMLVSMKFDHKTGKTEAKQGHEESNLALAEVES